MVQSITEKQEALKTAIKEMNSDWENDYKEKNDRLIKELEDKAGKDSVAELKENLEKMDVRQDKFHEEIDELNADIASSTSEHESKEDKVESDYAELYHLKLSRIQPGSDGNLTDGEKALVKDYRELTQDRMEAKVKSFNVGTANQGGHLVPTGDANKIITMMEAKVPFFGLSTVIDTDLKQTPFLIQNTVGASTVGDETTEETNSTTATVEEIRVDVWHYEAEPWITIEILEDSKLVNVLDFVQTDTVNSLADSFGQDVVSGTGSAEPKGILTSGGASGSYLVVEEIDATNGDNNAIGWDIDDMYTVKYDLDPRYILGTSSSWCGGNQAWGGMRKMRDANGQYFWQPSLVLGQPTMFDGDRAVYTPYMPTLTGSSDVDVMIFGDFKQGHVILRRPDAMRMILDPLTNKKYLKVYRKIRQGAGILDARALRILRTNAAT